MADTIGELNAVDLAADIHRLSGFPVVVAGIQEAEAGQPTVRLGIAGAGPHEAEAIAACLLTSLHDALELIVATTPACQPQLTRVAGALAYLQPLAGAQRGRH